MGTHTTGLTFPVSRPRHPVTGCTRLVDLDHIARRQRGVVALRQTSLSNDSWHRAIAAGSLIALHPGVACLVGTTGITTRPHDVARLIQSAIERWSGVVAPDAA